MTLEPLGDSAWLVEFPGLPADAAFARVMGLMHALANDRPAGVLDVVSSFTTVAVHFGDADSEGIKEWIGSVPVSDHLPAGTEREIPVCYGGENGPDLEDVARRTGMSPESVIALHAGAAYTVAAVGFSPGFPYLAGLPEALRLPRLASPRVSVPAGSVAIAGGQAGIYPFASPGGWHLLGRTSVKLFDPAGSPPARLQPGDRVRLVPVATLELPPPVEADSIRIPSSDRWIEVIAPGALTTVQDFGRFGHEPSGVSPGGVMDRHAMRLANLLVGNSEDAAVLELSLSGPVLRFHVDAVVALANTTGKPRRVAAGETVDFSKFTGGVRACLAVAGGFKVPMVLGSASTDLRGGFGGFEGRALEIGDRLEIGTASLPPRDGDWQVGRAGGRSIPEIEVRFIRGVQQDWFSKAAEKRLRSGTYQLSPRSDRMGARLSGPPLELSAPREMVSQPVACGSIQVPPDGQPIVLLAARQTIGGYPQIGHVISVDLPLLARAWPGTAVRFREVGLEQALALKWNEKRDFEWLRTGLELLKS